MMESERYQPFIYNLSDLGEYSKVTKITKNTFRQDILRDSCAINDRFRLHIFYEIMEFLQRRAVACNVYCSVSLSVTENQNDKFQLLVC